MKSPGMSTIATAYLLGRFHKRAGPLLALAGLAASRRAAKGDPGSGDGLLASPEVSALVDNFRQSIGAAVKKAAVAAVSQQLNSVTDRLAQRTESLREGGDEDEDRDEDYGTQTRSDESEDEGEDETEATDQDGDEGSDSRRAEARTRSTRSAASGAGRAKSAAKKSTGGATKTARAPAQHGKAATKRSAARRTSSNAAHTSSSGRER